MADFFANNQTGTVTNDQDAASALIGPGQTFVAIAANGTLKGTLNFEVSADGTNWAAIQVLNVGTGVIGSTATVDGSGGAIVTAWSVNVAGFTNVRTRLHTVTSGTATVTFRVGSVPSPVTGINTLAASTNTIGVVEVGDGVTPATKATVAQFHNTDNQNIGSGNGLLTGGIAQILNPAGLLDRQRGTGFDAIPAVGVATGTQQLAGAAITTTFNGAVTGSANSQTITVASTASMVVGDILKTQDNVEYVEVLTVPSGTTFTGILKNNHANSQSLTWFHYNQARDATIGDNVAATGLSPSATYLYNQVSGNMELDRSANGEKDGASGQGTGVAAVYDYNGQPLANGSVLSGLNFDRGRNVNGLGFGSGSISNNPLAANSTTFTLTGAPTTLQPGAYILFDRAGANPEVNYVGTGYTAGSTTVPLQIATQFSHAQNATVEWSQHAPLGPALNGFLAAGVGIEEEALFNPVDNKFYLERSATGDGVAAANVVMENPGLWNGATIDRQRGNLDNITVFASAAYGSTQTQADQTNYNHRGIIVVLDITVDAGATAIQTLEIDGKDPVSGKYYAILTSTALSAVATTVFRVYPGLTASTNLTVNDILPRTWRVKVTFSGSGTATYSVGAILIV